MEIIPSTVTSNLGPLGAPMTLLDQSAQFLYHGTKGHTDHPDFWHLAGLVCEAVLEVVCVSSLGYIAAKKGLFPAKVQKDMANLNIYFFTPCLIFSKLAAQLTGEKLTELWIIPIILLVQTVVSWLAAESVTRMIKLNKKPQRNFVIAMAVFGNSNSLPLSLVISLSHTISGLHWDKLPGDNDDDVGARGILYLLVFSQLGQAVRWSWGMNTLLRPLEDYTEEERGEIPRDEEDHGVYKDDDDVDTSQTDSPSQASSSGGSHDTLKHANGGAGTPIDGIKTDEFAPISASESGTTLNAAAHQASSLRTRQPAASVDSRSPIASVAETDENARGGFKEWRKKTWARTKDGIASVYDRTVNAICSGARKMFNSLPQALQKPLRIVWFWMYLTVTRFMGCLNVPLAAIIISVIVGSVPSIKAFFYTPGSFVNNTVTSAINQLAGVAVPLILFVLGGNLCKSTLPNEDLEDPAYRREKRQMLWSALICRMLIPLLVMAPFLGLLARYTPISILDDPIFIVVCFLLTGAPSALQLAQICQVNGVFVPVISQLLVQSYVVWIFPSTLVLVMLALEVVRLSSS